MNEVDRYSFAPENCGTDAHTEVDLHDFGEWVLYEDVAKAIANKDAEIARLRAIVDKLPRYAEGDPKAGQAFVPGVHECVVWQSNGNLCFGQVPEFDGSRWLVEVNEVSPLFTRFYSSEESARENGGGS